MTSKEFKFDIESDHHLILKILQAAAHSLSVRDIQSKLRILNRSLREDEIIRILRHLLEKEQVARNHRNH